MRPRHHFQVRSEIPEILSDFDELARNYHWAWDRELAALFDRLDGAPHGSTWRASSQHPIDLLSRTSPGCWERLAADGGFVAEVERASSRLRQTLEGPTWFDERRIDGSPLELVAYFSPEFGIADALPQYSGGLGVLAGDHLKASSDLGVPLVAIGLLYTEGYFHQELSADGWQHERNDRVDPADLGLTSTGIDITVDLAGVEATVRVWRADVGRIPLFLLDTNLPENPPSVAAVTDRLYGGDEQHRLRQEIVLGIGGVRALRALGLSPDTFHMNEGHAGFLGLERVREWTERGLTFAEAIEAVRSGAVFTTHTPVPAGIDRFPRDLFERYFAGFAEACNVDFDEFFELGSRADEPDGKFNMAVMGLRLAARRNGVARLHGAVSRSMFGSLWPDLPAAHTPIGHVTNGVHARTWVGDQVDQLLTEVIGDEWHLADAESWSRVHDVDHSIIWRTRSVGRRELVETVQSMLGPDVLDPRVLTIGFARRFATYKRATLLLSQPDRLRALLTDPDRPVQFVFAGKAHPADQPGKELIQQIHQLSQDPQVRSRFVFLPDYDIGIAKTMYHGCDVWLNTPRRPLEACGTSGMKAALNGALNLSIRDGWWDEMSTGENGWDIPSFDDDHDLVRRDRREADATFELIEQELLPLFYATGEDDVPHGWVDRIAANWATLGWNVIAGRMVRQYVTGLYEPASASAHQAEADGGAAARELAAWKHGVRAAWESVTVQMIDAGSDLDDGLAGTARTVVARVDPGRLRPDEILMQVVHGPLRSDGEFEEQRLEAVEMQPGDDGVHTATFCPSGSGPWGVTVRAVPVHHALSSPYDTGLVASG